jgi:membrane associated rhomboid family serine protease
MSQLQQWLNPRSSSAKMAVLFVIFSVAYYVTERWTGDWIPLQPVRVTGELMLWQLVTYAALFSRNPMSFIFGVLIIVSIGGALERHWGAKRVWVFSFAIAVVSALITVALSLVVPAIAVTAFAGADLIVGVMWVAYGLLMGRAQTNFWGLPVTGNTLALIGASFVLLSGLLARTWVPLIPEVIALALTFVHVRLGFPQEALQRFGSWRLQRDLNRRSSHLRVITGDQRNTPGDSDKYLH